MQLEDYSELIKKLEDDELESPTGATAELYIQLLAAYIFENDLTSAKFLWKRIPQNIKAGNVDLEKLCLLALALVNNNTSEFFKVITHTWPPSIEELMKKLEDKIREDVFTLVGKAYTSIYENNLMELTQLSSEQLRKTCEEIGWRIEVDGQQNVIIPKRTNEKKIEAPNSEDQLFKLTDFVSFLEN